MFCLMFSVMVNPHPPLGPILASMPSEMRHADGMEIIFKRQALREEVLAMHVQGPGTFLAPRGKMSLAEWQNGSGHRRAAYFEDATFLRGWRQGYCAMTGSDGASCPATWMLEGLRLRSGSGYIWFMPPVTRPWRRRWRSPSGVLRGCGADMWWDNTRRC